MRHLLIALLSGAFLSSYGQYAEPKYANIDIADLKMTKYDKDTTADALILFDDGFSKFALNSDQEFQFIYERHYRIKLFKKTAFYLADVSLRLRHNNSGKEKLSGLKASTFNLVNGKIVQTKLENSKIFEVEEDNFTTKKFAFPEVKEGSIIEITYSIISDFLYDFRGWKFQYSCPALWSQYRFHIPQYFTYRVVSKGYLPFDINQNKNGIEVYNIHYGGENTSKGERTAAENYSIKATTKETILAVKDVPAFISEPNIDCEDNYKQSIEFELSSVQYPNSQRTDYSQTWESVNEQMKDDHDFGVLLSSAGFIKDTVTAICRNISTELEKTRAIYNYVQNRMKWNGIHSLWSLKGLKKPFTERIGNSSEINLLLTMMLQNAGIKANPVLLSTRDNGFINTMYPTITKFNSVLTKAEIAGKVILMDPISKYCPFGLLPANDLNGKGLVVNNETGGWIDLKTDAKYKEIKTYDLSINPEGSFNGSISGAYADYAGIVYRSTLSSEKNNDDYIRKIQENLKGLTINSYSISDNSNNNIIASDTFKVEVTDHAELIGDKILFNPLLFERLEKNRYTLEERKYPVDYNYPISELYTFNYTIPEGYKVESLPQSVSMTLPDNSIVVSYQVKNTGNKINIEYKREISKILFLPAEYKKLKEFYDDLVKKQAEQIILKKSV